MRSFVFFAGERIFRVTCEDILCILQALHMVGFRVLFSHFLRGSVYTALSAAALCAQIDTAQETEATAMRHKARLTEQTREGMQLIEEGRQAYSQRKYSRAVELFSQALEEIPNAPATASRREYAKHCLADAYISTAIDYKNVGRIDEAREMLEKAITLAPNEKRAAHELALLNDPVRNNPALTPQHIGNVEEVSRLLTLAYGYFDLGNYDKAISSFNDVLRLDPYNEAAAKGKERCQNAKSKYYQTAHDAARAKALADVSATWEEGNAAATPKPASIQKETTLIQNDEANTVESEIASIVLPRVVFQDATIDEILDSLRTQIRRYEQNNGALARPLNIVTNFGSSSSALYKQLKQRKISIDLSDISLKSLLRIIGNQTGTIYYTTPIGVEFTFSGKDYGPLISESFHVPSRFFTDTEEEDSSEEDVFAVSSSSLKVRRLNPMKSLQGMGITFPKGASAQYHPSTSTLTVRNTPTNIEAIRELVSVPLESERIVALNVTIAEVNEKDLKELGFEWLLNFSFGGHSYGAGGTEQNKDDNNDDGKNFLEHFVSPARKALEAAQVGTQAPLVSAGLRSGTQAIATDSIDKLLQAGSPEYFSATNTTKAPGILAVRGVWSSADVTVLMRGLDQKKAIDILEAPKILFTPGSDQQIKFSNVREIYYPETYDPPSFGNNNNQSQPDPNDPRWRDDDRYRRNNSNNAQVVLPAHPTEFIRYTSTGEEEGGIGSTLLIHDAEIENSGTTVTLSLTVFHNSFDGFINYGSPIHAPIYENNKVTDLLLSENRILKPVFSRKCINTKITTTPGNTLVLGSLFNSKKVRFEDKIPVLGDLPLVGRLFRSEGTENERKALLIFAKVDVVDPSGRDINTGEYPTSVSGISSSPTE